MDVPSGWVQIIRGPRPPSQRWPKSHEQKPTIGRWRNHQNQEVKVPAMPRQARVGPAAARDLAKNMIVQLERALEAMGGMEGPAVQAIKMELEKARLASKKPPLNVEIEEARKFITRSVRRLKEMEEERRVEERLLSEAQENLKNMLAEQERGSSHPEPPQDVTSQVTDLQQMVNDQQKASLWSRGNPKFRAGVGRMDVHEASRFARCSGNRTERVGGGDITVDCQRCFGSASLHSEQHGHVKGCFLHQWRGVRVGELSNPGPVTTRSASRILAT